MRRNSYQVEVASLPKYKYSFNDKTFDLNISSSLQSKIGATRAKAPSLILNQRIKSNSSFTLDKLVTRQKAESQLAKPIYKTTKKELKLPTLQKRPAENPEIKNISSLSTNNTTYYMGRVAKSFEAKQTSYLVALARQHFLQTIEAIKIGRSMQIPNPIRQIKLAKKNPKLKTVCLDLDETLIHCDEMSNNYTVKLDFPVEGGGSISAGVRVRPHCSDFLRQLSSIAEIIVFTASSASYADVVLDYLDPQKRYFSHRLYRQHCTLEKGYYTKDLRCINRRLEDMVLVDNSAYSFMIQPQNGVPILPYYHYGKDKELLSLLQFLKDILDSEDVRTKLKKYFFWHKYVGEQDPKKIFFDNCGSQTK